MLFKALNTDQTNLSHEPYQRWTTPYKTADGTWKPGKWKPGKWTWALRDSLDWWDDGVFLCHKHELIDHLGPVLYEAESHGEYVDYQYRPVYKKIRLLRQVETWNERTMRLFVCDCVEHAIDLCEQWGKFYFAARRWIESIRQFANGKLSNTELYAVHKNAMERTGCTGDEQVRTEAWIMYWAVTHAASSESNMTSKTTHLARRATAQYLTRPEPPHYLGGHLMAGPWLSTTPYRKDKVIATEREWQSNHLMKILFPK